MFYRRCSRANRLCCREVHHSNFGVQNQGFAPFSGSRRPPSCYVSYQSAEQESPLCTEVVMKDDSPTWSYNLQTRLHKELLTDDLKVPSCSLLGSGHQLREGGYKTGGGGGGK